MKGIHILPVRTLSSEILNVKVIFYIKVIYDLCLFFVSKHHIIICNLRKLDFCLERFLKMYFTNEGNDLFIMILKTAKVSKL